MTEIRLLGPVEIWVEKTAWDVGPPQRRATLAALAANAGRPVSPEALVHRVWGEDHPDTARRALHAHITRLRRVFEQAGQHGEKVRLVRRSGGYVLDVAADRVDLLRFRS